MLSIVLAIALATPVAIIIANRYAKSTAQLRAAQLLAAGPPELADGDIVTLTGTVKPIESLAAPVSQRSCVAFRIYVRMGAAWLTEVKMTRFVLETTHGEVTVEPFQSGDVQLAVPADAVRPQDATQNAAATEFLKRRGRRSYEIDAAKYEEQIVAPDARVAVHGVIHVELAAPELGVETGFRDVARRLRLIGTSAHPLAIGPWP